MYFPEKYHVHRGFEGDFPEELAMMNSFYRGANSGNMNIFKIKHTSCFKCHARSRWLTAFHSAMMMSGFSGERMAFVGPSILMFGSFSFMLMRLAKSFLKNFILAIAVLILALFAGGLGFFDWFDVGQGKDLDFVFNTGLKTTEWSHPLFHYIFGHRPSQMSLCIAVAIIYLLSEAPSRRDMACAGILAGLLPACQHQAFLGMIVWLIVYGAIDFVTGRKQIQDKLRQFVSFGIFFAISGLVPLIHYAPRQFRTSMMKSEYYWQGVVNRGAFFPKIRLWWDALGVFGLIVLVICWLAFDVRLLKLYIPSLAAFAFGN
jgi:hypothetical protein